MDQLNKFRCKKYPTIVSLCTIMVLLLTMFCSTDCKSQTVVDQQSLGSDSGKTEGYETPGVIKAQEILPLELLEGENFRVHDDVVTYGFTNYYTIVSPFGTFEVKCDDMLPIRLHEVQAITALQDIKKTEVFGDALKNAAVSPVKGVWGFITHPVDTVSGVSKGVGRLFSRTGEMVKGKRGDSEDSVTKELLGFSKVKRQYAHILGVDVYSSNKELQKELNSVSWTGFAGGADAALATILDEYDYKEVYNLIKTTELTDDLNEMLLEYTPEDLRRINREKLKLMGIEDSVIEEFLDHRKYTPRHETIIVHILAEMGEGVKNRGLFLEQALFAESELDAFIFQRIAEMMYGYHTQVKHIIEIIPVGRAVVGYTADRTIVIRFPVDYLYWTERVDIGLKAVTGLQSADRPVKQVELWADAERITPRARQELKAAGVVIKSRKSNGLITTVGIESDSDKSKKPGGEGLIPGKDKEGTVSRPYIGYQEPEFLSYEELVALYLNPLPAGYFSRGPFEEKVFRFFRTPIIDNRPYYRGVKPHHPVDDQIGPFLRVVSWNIEQSINMEDVIDVFLSEEELRKRIDSSKIKKDVQKFNNILNQREKLTTADIIVLQEMEIGVKRSGYLNAAGELAKALEMNYSFAPQYLEIDPVQLGLEEVHLEDGSVDEEATEYFLQDKDLFKGVFGSAVLSRYPIKSVTVVPLRNQGYDWYHGEKEKATYLEKARRLGAKVAFKEEIVREVKTGGRGFFRVDLDVPDIPGNTLTIINIHLEIKCLPKVRDLQIKEILNYIKDIDNPVIMLGDFNAAPSDISPTSVRRVVKRETKKPIHLLSLAPYGFVAKTASYTVTFTKNLDNPLAAHVPVIAPNPVKAMFDRIEDFRFDDGGAFDFRGDKERSVNGKKGKLANSNQRDMKAFKTTYSVVRPLVKVIGKYRLDWMFVKSNLKDPLDEDGPYRFAPHYGETLTELNNNLYERLSDHDPCVIDIPFLEPSQWDRGDKSDADTGARSQESEWKNLIPES